LTLADAAVDALVMVEIWDTVLAEVGSQAEADLRKATFSISRASGKRKEGEGVAKGRAPVITNKPCKLHAFLI
jgi:hypothetical protein